MTGRANWRNAGAAVPPLSVIARFALLGLLTLAIGTLPAAAATGLAFIVNSAGASISVVDMATLKELRRIPVLREPHHVALTPDGKTLLVGDTAATSCCSSIPPTAT